MIRKRMIFLLVAAALVLAVAGCSAANTKGYDIYNEVIGIEQVAESSSILIEAKMEIAIGRSGDKGTAW